MRGLSAQGVENAALIARVGTGKEVSAQLSSDYLRLSRGLGPHPEVIGELPLIASDKHTVTMTVSPTAIMVVVDGSVRLSVPADAGPGSYGGIGLTSSRKTKSTSWPSFTALSVTKGPDLPNVRSGVGVPVGG